MVWIDIGRSLQVKMIDERLEEEVKDKKESRFEISGPESSCDKSTKVDFGFGEE